MYLTLEQYITFNIYFPPECEDSSKQSAAVVYQAPSFHPIPPVNRDPPADEHPPADEVDEDPPPNEVDEDEDSLVDEQG